MLHRRLPRIATAFFVVLALLFSQMALAGYVCPVQSDAAAMAAMAEAGVPCDGMDEDQPVLCHQHAADPAKTFEAAKLPAAAQPALVQVLEPALAPDVRQARMHPRSAASTARPPPAPLFLSTLRLRV